MRWYNVIQVKCTLELTQILSRINPIITILTGNSYCHGTIKCGSFPYNFALIHQKISNSVFLVVLFIED